MKISAKKEKYMKPKQSNNSTASEASRSPRNSSRIGRRELLKQGLLAAASFPLLAGAAWPTQMNSPTKGHPTKTSVPKSKSVFQNDACKTGNSYKYTHHDSSDMYPFLAFGSC
jgi:hypothetical protein